jgi:hypothetical protein
MLFTLVTKIQLNQKNSKQYQKSEICTLRLLCPIELEKKYPKYISNYIMLKNVETSKYDLSCTR